MEDTKVANGDAVFHSVNSMQDIGGSLDPIAMAFGADKDIVTKLTEAVETLTINNASLTTQLRGAMKINLEMAKKLNINATQAQDPEYTSLAEKASKKSVFESNLDPKGYCCTHGFRATKRHRIQTCSTPAAGHQKTASRKIAWGEASQSNDTSR